MYKNNQIIAAFISMAAFSLAGCSEDKDLPKQAYADAEIVDCDWRNMDRIKVDALSMADKASVCSTMASSTGRQPNARMVTRLGKTVAVFLYQGSKEEPKEIAYQLMNVIEALGKTGNDDAIYASLDDVVKIYNGSQGHVTPRDLNIALRPLGASAHNLTSDGLYTIGAIIQEDKKARGL